MKKTLLLAAVAGLMAVSCKKNYTCECVTSSNLPGYTSDTYQFSLGKMKKKDAESKCDTYDDTWTSWTYDEDFNKVTYTYTDECSVK